MNPHQPAQVGTPDLLSIEWHPDSIDLLLPSLWATPPHTHVNIHRDPNTGADMQCTLRAHMYKHIHTCMLTLGYAHTYMCVHHHACTHTTQLLGGDGQQYARPPTEGLACLMELWLSAYRSQPSYSACVCLPGACAGQSGRCLSGPQTWLSHRTCHTSSHGHTAHYHLPTWKFTLKPCNQ